MLIGCSMPLPEHLLENIVTAVLSGGGTAVSAIVAFFRDVKKRIDDLEKRVGSMESRTGLVHSVSSLEQSMTQLKADISSWVVHPPEWLIQAVTRGRRPSSMLDLSEFSGIDDRLRQFENKLKNMEDTVDRLERKVNRCVSEEDFESADRARAEDIATVRTAMAEVNGLLKGLQTALGMVKGGRG